MYLNNQDLNISKSLQIWLIWILISVNYHF